MRADEPYEGQKGTNAMKSVFYYDTPIGRLGLAENGRAVTDVLLHGEHPADAEIRETPLLQKAAEQLAEYFGGLRTEFELPLEFEIGTPFERTVWQALSTIPYGETRSYADIARQIGRPAACRAVGRARLGWKNSSAIASSRERAGASSLSSFSPLGVLTSTREAPWPWSIRGWVCPAPQKSAMVRSPARWRSQHWHR